MQFYWKNGYFAFLTPSPFEGLEAAYNVHLRLIGKPVFHFILVAIELLSLGFRLMRYERL